MLRQDGKKINILFIHQRVEHVYHTHDPVVNVITPRRNEAQL